MKKKTVADPLPPLSAEERAVQEWILGVNFKKKRFGGVDEADVWKKIGELNRLYEKLLIVERAKSASAIPPASNGQGGRNGSES